MKIIVLGGAGEMGKRTVEDLAAAPGISRITVADINLPAAKKLLSEISSETELAAIRLDAFQQHEVIRAIRGNDIVVSALGPYHVFEERMINAVIEAGVDYISICDEWDIVDKMINEYHDLAKNCGVQIICGMGASPGLTNIVAMNLSSRMHRVDRIDISVWLPLDTGAGVAAIEHGIYIMSGEMAVWRNSGRQMIRACSERSRKDLPGLRNQSVWNMGHPEPVTLPQSISGVKDINFYMGFGTGSFLLTGPSRLGWYEIPALRKVFTKSFVTIEKLLSAKSARNGSSRIDVWGKLDGADKHRTAFGVSTMQESTALTLSVGVQMLAQKELLTQDGGVYAPEAIFDSAKCLGRLVKKRIKIYEDIELTIPL